MAIRVRLDELMRERGIGYGRLAAATGVPKSTLYEARKERRWPSKKTVEALCRYFQIPVGELLVWVPDE